MSPPLSPVVLTKGQKQIDWLLVGAMEEWCSGSLGSRKGDSGPRGSTGTVELQFLMLGHEGLTYIYFSHSALNIVSPRPCPPHSQCQVNRQD